LEGVYLSRWPAVQEQVKLYAYPVAQSADRRVITAQNMQVAPNRNIFIPPAGKRCINPSRITRWNISNYSREVLAEIQTGMVLGKP